MSGLRFARAAVRRLCQTLATGDPARVLEAGTLVSALVTREADTAAAARRAAAILEAVLLAAADTLPETTRARLEHAVEECLCLASGPPAPARLDDLWRDLAALLEAPAEGRERGSLGAAIQDYLAASVDRRATLGDLARRLGYSPAHVSTLVRRLTGKPFRVVRREMRLARARSLLERGASIKVAALESGFSDPAYFSRVFTRHHGVPPSRWREARGDGNGRVEDRPRIEGTTPLPQPGTGQLCRAVPRGSRQATR
jgi:AraC-like DNA-binding protein